MVTLDLPHPYSQIKCVTKGKILGRIMEHGKKKWVAQSLKESEELKLHGMQQGAKLKIRGGR